MSKIKKDSADLTLAERIEQSLNGFITRNKKLLIIILAVVVVGLITLGIVSSVTQKNQREQFNLIDELEATYAELLYTDSEDASYQGKYDSLVASLTELSAKGKEYPNLKAGYLLGMLSFEESSYQTAMETFLSVYSNADGSYLGSLALTNAAVAAEELGDSSLALEYYTKVLDEFGFTAAEAPKALFGQARLQEQNGNIDLAKATFQQLADQFPSSEFAKLATNRLALL
mgnify:CR=1 FL=1